MSRYLFSKWLMDKGNAQNHFHDTHMILMIRNSCKTDHSTQPCGHSNIKLCGYVNTKA